MIFSDWPWRTLASQQVRGETIALRLNERANSTGASFVLVAASMN